jgi:hypothetical protein
MSQKVIAILTMLFLPSTFIAVSPECSNSYFFLICITYVQVLFTMPLFNWDPQPGEHVLNSRFWIYATFACSLTAGLFLLYIFRHLLAAVNKRAKKLVGIIKRKWDDRKARTGDEESCCWK